MIKHSLLIITLLFSLLSTAQINFEKGYYINNQGKKIDCLIKNMDWKNNPTQIKYKLNETDNTKTLFINNLKAFGIDDKMKFEKHRVKIDRDLSALNELNFNREPNLKIETLLLRILVEGQTTLYQYKKDGLTRFFFLNNANKGIEPLIYKRYKNLDNNIIENTEYKQQLLNHVKCENISIKEINKVKYTKNSLSDYFKRYFQCINNPYKDFTKKDAKNGKLIFSIRPGLDMNSLSIKNKVGTLDNFGVAFGSKTSFRLGLEIEYVLPFNKNKWSIFFEPTYQSFKSNGITRLNEDVNIDYKSIEFPIGLRHYFYLNDASKIYINMAVLLDMSLSENIDYSTSEDLDLSSNANFAFGIGYKYKKYSLEFRYQNPRNVLDDYLNWDANFNTSSIIFGYSIFDTSKKKPH